MTQTKPTFDDKPLATREDIQAALSRIMGADVDSRELATILRTVTGWNEATCKRYARSGLVLDARRRDILIEQIHSHEKHMKEFEKWLASL